MIVTVTPNPSLDRTFELDALVTGQVNRARSVHHDAGGKGINVSRALARHGVPTTAVLPAGGPVGDRLVAMLREVGVEAVGVPVAGETRTNVTLVDAAGVTTKVNAGGPALTADEVDALVDAVERLVALRPRAVVAAGSVPGGAAADLYPRLARIASEGGTPFVLDTSGQTLVDAVAAGGIALLKPNDDELAELVRARLRTVGDVVAAARQVQAAGVAELLVSLGAHGALLVTPDDHWWAGGPPVVPLSTVGAGDTALAGFLSVDPSTGPSADADDGHARRLRTAVAWGRAAVLCPGSAVPAPEDVHEDVVRVLHRPDPSLALEELR
ncbi:1-phosphofructokinase family hexose kinase [Cellulomonas carbonis]|uniref:6-phosphofructokinase n=1 Tax=Cellulomonas carbonis T26 TaxID=947969 RepID=A0A0A0BPW5_9CELL|nr:1-phosphofructokinase family hexose kinase [Cellulomonas carbonis]KGM09119.1 6-phosphofructokinase [Cellulomonas carbonis T26]GGC10408.1 1-phosphofructokinase [Cellulomonas carbonis]